MANEMTRKVAVLGFNADGNPDVWEATVTVTEDQFDDGEHSRRSQYLDKATELAEADDFLGYFAIDVEDEMPSFLERLNALYPKTE